MMNDNVFQTTVVLFYFSGSHVDVEYSLTRYDYPILIFEV